VFPLLFRPVELANCAFCHHALFLQYSFREIKRCFLTVEENPRRGTEAEVAEESLDYGDNVEGKCNRSSLCSLLREMKHQQLD
jgi:hypothetical protein